MLRRLFAAIALAVAAITTTSSSVDAAQDSAQAFLDLHNATRAEVGVAPLAWDDTVAAYARTFAAERKGDCALAHSGGPYGESLFWGSSGASWTAADAVSSWVAEKQSYNCEDNSCGGASGLPVCGHYTQVVWANTIRVGCATVTCDGQSGTFIVCEYDPPGNVVGQRPYAGCGQFNRSAQSPPQDFLTLQNAFRAGLGIGMLSWDSSLAAYTETYAEKRKRDCQKISSNGPYGENIFQGAGGSGASDALFSWFGEKQYYNCTTNKCESGGACGDYTQLIWANSTRVGCASVICKTMLAAARSLLATTILQAMSPVSGRIWAARKKKALHPVWS
ncbi:Cysteine-rich receptor-like protein kinase 29 [Panicum miliaceum]|uniref:Cysteine-rich receptor-like protein kinase 29 n=1 Tax=Panicum miliaceum TaxID=4540 RepID=A0A3L6RNM7_PANMI|nr:Cysteine-rich receptor-like protein kinase 29 [Panicum miliaceum]